MEQELSVERYDMTSDAMSPATVMRQVKLIQEVMREAMREGEHYGVIPGCGNKPSLLKPGAEKLSLTFRLSPAYEVIEKELPKAHREYRVKCTLTHIPSNTVFGEGVGSCSTMEGKYRFRKAEQKCPQCGKETIIKGKKEYGGGWLCFAKKGGCGAKFKDDDPAIENQNMGRIEHDNPADYYNTVLKMAKKRAHVDATLTATAASDIFTQDIEDMDEVISADAVPKSSKSISTHTDNENQSPKPMSDKQRKMLWAKMMEKGMSKEIAKSFFEWVNPKTSQEASKFIEEFEAILKSYMDNEQPGGAS
jgi:hypothetical protein